MARIFATAAKCSIAKMPKHDFTKHGNAPLQFQRIHVAQIMFGNFCGGSQRRIKEPLNWTALAVAKPRKKWFARRRVKFHAGNSRAILPAVVLLLHEQI